MDRCWRFLTFSLCRLSFIHPAWLTLIRQATLDSGTRHPWFAQETRQVWPAYSQSREREMANPS